MKRILFCNIAYMKHYDHYLEPNDIPMNGGSYVTINNDAGEKYNFHLYDDGYYKGFVETKYVGGYGSSVYLGNNYKKIHIENIDKNYKKCDEIDDVLVVFCAKKEPRKSVIVGWYEHATVLRGRKYISNNAYNIYTKEGNAYLIPEEERNFIVPRAKFDPYRIGFGMSNLWYCNKENAKDFKEKVINYIENFNNKFGEELEDIENLRTYKEGSKNIIISKVQRKRNIQARLECLKIHGYKCAICGFESEKVYGPEFKNKIEVHHINPIHSKEVEYYIDPKTELIPVCPNCHTILHSKKSDGAYPTFEEIKEKLNK